MPEWKPVPGWNGYLVSDQGEIKGIHGRVLRGQPAGSRREYRAIDLAAEFGVSKSVVSLIKLGRTYQDA